MKKYSILLVLLLMIAAFAADNQTATFPAIEGWDIKISDDVYVPENLWDMINGGADFYVKSGFVDLHTAEYTNAEGITVYTEIYRFSSEANAFGIYTSERIPDYKFLETGGQSYLGEGILNIYDGIFYIKLSSYGESGIDKALLTVADEIVTASGQDKKLPELLSFFPQEGKVEYSERFITNNFLGYDFLKNGFMVDYADGYQLFIIDGGDVNGAQNMVSDWLEITKQSAGDLTDQHPFVIHDPVHKDISVVLHDHFLVASVNGSSPDAAKVALGKLLKKLE